jgi:hypothetical protein
MRSLLAHILRNSPALNPDPFSESDPSIQGHLLNEYRPTLLCFEEVTWSSLEVEAADPIAITPHVRFVVDVLWICCTAFWPVVDKSNMLWICYRVHNKSATSGQVEMLWICCGFAIQLVIQQIHYRLNKWSWSSTHQIQKWIRLLVKRQDAVTATTQHNRQLYNNHTAYSKTSSPWPQIGLVAYNVRPLACS